MMENAEAIMFDPKHPEFRPLFFIKPDSMSPKDIKRAEKSGICIVECADPEAIRQCQPLPLSTVNAQARAALEFIRFVVSYPNQAAVWTKGDVAKSFVELLLRSEKPAETEQVKPVKKV